VRGADGSYGYEALLRLVVGRILREGGMPDIEIERLFAASGASALEDMLLEAPSERTPSERTPPERTPPERTPPERTPPAPAPAPPAGLPKGGPPPTIREGDSGPKSATPAARGAADAAATTEQAELMRALVRLRVEQVQLTDENAALGARLESLREAGARLAARHVEAEADLETLRHDLEKARRARDGALASRAALEAETAHLNAALAEARIELAATQQALREARAEAEALAPAQAQLAQLLAEIEARQGALAQMRAETGAMDAHRDRIARFVNRAGEIRDRLRQAEGPGAPER
jgi:hypothetical protein